jgi:Rv0078B-related antitoxin
MPDSSERNTVFPNGVAIAFDLLETALQMRAQRHRREHPEATEAEIATVVRAWRLQRPGAEFGDTAGNVIPWPREPKANEIND